MPIRTVKITAEHREELIQLCRQYADLQTKAVEIRWALNDQVATLAGLVENGEVAGLSIDFTQIEVVTIEEWKKEPLNVSTSGRWVCPRKRCFARLARRRQGGRLVQVDAVQHPLAVGEIFPINAESPVLNALPQR